MAPTKLPRTPSDSSDGGISDLLEENLNDGTNTRKRSFVLLPPKGTFSRVINDINDDELERKKRQEEEKQVQKDATQQIKPTPAKPFSLLSNLTPAELEDHYTQCIRMCNQNKVNPKNAFKLQLIDYMKLILMTQNKKTENLSLMSCTLDASAKIYSCRVDKVYSDMMKIMSGKEWAGEDETDNTDDESVEKEKGEEDVVPKKKKKSDKGDKEGNIDLEKMLWSEARLDKSEGELENTNYIVYGRTPLPSNAEFFLDCPLSDADGQLTLNGQLFSSSQMTSTDSVLRNFTTKYQGSFDSLDPAEVVPGYQEMFQEKTDVSVVIDNNLVYEKDSHLLPESLRVEEDGNAGENLNDGPAMVDYDDCVSDDDGVEPTPLPSQNSTNIGQLSAPRASFSVNGMTKFVSARRSEYSFFDENFFNLTAGPVHWSLKNRKKIIKSKEVPKSTKKEVMGDFSVRQFGKLRKMFSESVKLQLTSNTMKLWCKTNHSLPASIYNQRNIVSLIRDNNLIYITNDFKYGLYGDEESSKELKDLNQSLTPEDFNEMRCGEDDDDDDEICNDNDDNHVSERIPSPADISPANLNNGNDLDLVPAPPKVNKIPIKYAKVQKRIDIKLLKSTIWDLMDLDQQESRKESTKNGNLEEGMSDSATSPVEVKLSEIYNALPGKLPEEEAKQLSFPIVFMAILHMANEKTLKLIGDGGYKDVTISRG